MAPMELVLVRLILGSPEAAGSLWCRWQAAWVQPLQQLEARRARQARQLAGKLCEVVRARWTLPRRQVWLRVLRW